MAVTKDELLQRVEADKGKLIEFLQGFIRCPSPNPPGDTQVAVAYIRKFLEERNLPHRLVAPNPIMANIVGSFACGGSGRHLVLNGHIDVFPVGDGAGWSHGGPWSGALADGKIFGRGACDMKCGTTASIFTYAYMHSIRDQLRGKLTLTCVSDEETFGPYGARYLFEKHRDEVKGDTCLNGEPSSPYTVRYGEKGPMWLTFTVKTKGGHGAYNHVSKSANAIAAELIGKLKKLEKMPVPENNNLMTALDAAKKAMDKAYGAGGAKIVRTVTVNPGVIRGGMKVNMISNECSFELDVRLPNGVTDKDIIKGIDAIVAKYPEVSYRVDNFNPPSYCPPDGEMIQYVKANAKAIGGFDPMPVISLGGTDARLWRYHDTPGIVYGPSPKSMGQVDEHVTVKEFMHVVKTHVACAFDYMSRG
ncbi:MAG: M20/M25/M40 family metallo-hydrolase [Alphaproteobacteria bacterium]|nr:M20/M25/M40 family metallo-hydrolase [Alphaproteobacteria bacterium]